MIIDQGQRLNQISPSQRGYRDGWRAHDPVDVVNNAPYLYGTWAYREWLQAFVEARVEVYHTCLKQ